MDNHDEMEIDLMDITNHLLKKWWLILSSGALCALLGFLLSACVISPRYEASTRIYILSRSSSESVSYSDYQISDRMLADYKVLITGQNVTKQVIEELELNMSVKDLEKMIAVTAPDNTRVVQISVTHNDSKLAADIANCVREVASEQIQKIMDVESVNLVYEADIPEEPTSPSMSRWTIGTCVLGMVLSVIVLTGQHLLDDSIRTEEDVEKYLGLSVLGVIPESADLESMDGQMVTSIKNARIRKTRKMCQKWTK